MFYLKTESGGVGHRLFYSKTASGDVGQQNLLPSERTMIHTTLNRNVGFNDSDMNFGSVLYPRDLYLEQCKKYVFDGKGTYEYTEKPKDFILEDVTSRLKNLPNDCFGRNPPQNLLRRHLRDGQKIP